VVFVTLRLTYFVPYSGKLKLAKNVVPPGDEFDRGVTPDDIDVVLLFMLIFEVKLKLTTVL